MSENASNAKPQRSILSKLLFFWFPAILILFGLIAITFLLAPSLRLITTPITLPEFSGPQQEDFWSLQKKLVDIPVSASASVSLSESEFNAFLSGFQLPPEGGFCLQRLRCHKADNEATFYIIGSGFFMRSLIFKIAINLADSDYKTSSIWVNSLELPSNSWLAETVTSYLCDQALRKPDSFIARFIQGKANISIDKTDFILQGELVAKPQPSEDNEIPEVEIETPSEITK